MKQPTGKMDIDGVQVELLIFQNMAAPNLDTDIGYRENTVRMPYINDVIYVDVYVIIYMS